MERAVFVYTTWPTSVEAAAPGRTLVERRLAAWVNILTGSWQKPSVHVECSGGDEDR
jgi:uncharacterized protein involved in tolerance to divalent cations